MRNFTFLSVIITGCFLMFSFSPATNAKKLKNDLTEFENVYKINAFSFGTISVAEINSFYKKYPKLKIYQKDVEELYKKKDYNLIWHDDKNVSEFGGVLYHKGNLLNDQGIKVQIPYKDFSLLI